MEYKKLLIAKNEEDTELAAKGTSVYDASPECKSQSENKNHIKQSARQEAGSSLFHRKAILILIIIVVLSLITIISITIWVIFIKKAETTINPTTTTTTIGVSTTKIAMPTTSTMETTMLTSLIDSHTTTMNEPKLNRWKQNAITVAGGNGQGQELNQLNWPEGIFIDKNKNIFIADYFNHRIVEWKCNAKQGQIIAGGNYEGNQMDQLNSPRDVIIDEQNHSIIVADQGNSRVIQWLNQTQQILIHNINCYGLAMDKYGFLYVSDWNRDEVRRWKMGEYNEGIVVAGGNGKGNKLNQLNFPTFIFVDEDQSVYVSDRENHRVMKWKKDAKEGTIVAGGNGRGAYLNQLSEPAGVAVDDLGHIYVADCNNHRIMRWCEAKEEGEIVIGENVEGTKSNQLDRPRDLSFDDEGNLYVADDWNQRIEKFERIL